ncbi:GntR family transcriptional regulator [Eggerthella lenta]|uniref:GntR family transcriptional regulator n=1 Tax=Eggerthella lenta TaxID=84112 RepID=UPI000DF811BA|nr:GntR family transcriptional regulator [Eggerthella lenta]RDC03130.1 GntR family transcriptional regulator [Eggerthella lenta]
MTAKPIPSFEVDESSDLPLWVRLRDRLVYLINTGYYKPGDQLPTVRKFASELCISYNTISKAYVALEREGYISTTQGRGAFVCEPDGAPDAPDVDALMEDFVKSCLEKGMAYDDIPKRINKTIRKLKREYEKK